LRDAVEKIILLREWNKILKDSIEKKNIQWREWYKILRDAIEKIIQLRK
jgi:hypothetical protein